MNAPQILELPAVLANCSTILSGDESGILRLANHLKAPKYETTLDSLSSVHDFLDESSLAGRAVEALYNRHMATAACYLLANQSSAVLATPFAIIDVLAMRGLANRSLRTKQDVGKVFYLAKIAQFASAVGLAVKTSMLLVSIPVVFAVLIGSQLTCSRDKTVACWSSGFVKSVLRQTIERTSNENPKLHWNENRPKAQIACLSAAALSSSLASMMLEAAVLMPSMCADFKIYALPLQRLSAALSRVAPKDYDKQSGPKQFLLDLSEIAPVEAVVKIALGQARTRASYLTEQPDTIFESALLNFIETKDLALSFFDSNSQQRKRFDVHSRQLRKLNFRIDQ